MIVTEAILYERSVIETITASLEKSGISTVVFDEVTPNATSVVAESAVDTARVSHADMIIGLGGIRALSIAKFTAMTVPGTKSCDDVIDDGYSGLPDPLYYAEIPSTARNPFLFSDDLLIVNARDRSPRIIPAHPGITKTAVIDPKLSLGIPSKYTAATLTDTLLTAMEGYFSVKATIFSEPLFLKALELLWNYTPGAVKFPQDIQFRIHGSGAGLLTALGLATVPQGLGSAIAYAINTRYLIPKSWIASVLLPSIMERYALTGSDKFQKLALLFDPEGTKRSAEDSVNFCLDSVRSRIDELKLPVRLRDLDIDLDRLQDTVASALKLKLLSGFPVPITEQEVLEMLKSVY